MTGSYQTTTGEQRQSSAWTMSRWSGRPISFLDYWTGVPGARGTKRNWLGTWRNWCRKCIEQQGSSAGPKPRQVWRLSDDELLKMAAERSIATRGLSRAQLVAAIEARH